MSKEFVEEYSRGEQGKTPLEEEYRDKTDSTGIIVSLNFGSDLLYNIHFLGARFLGLVTRLLRVYLQFCMHRYTLILRLQRAGHAYN